jgi:uncharacterized membrane protein YfcA
MKTVLLVALGLVGAAYLFALGKAVAAARRTKSEGTDSPTPSGFELFIGLVTNFFDTLGIGSFAPTTALFKMFRLVPDEKIPGTLNVGHTPPTITQAFLFITAVAMDVTTLVLMIAAAVTGSWVGAGVVSGWPRRNIQIGMGCALLVAASIFLMQIFGIAAPGGDTLALGGTRLVVGLGVNFILGALMQVGVGLYGPCLILVSLLGMNPQAAFPIMMGSCAFLMPIGSLKFIEHQRFSLRSTMGLALGGVPAVLIAFYIVKSLDIRNLRVLVVIVVLYAALSMLRSAYVERFQIVPPAEGVPVAKP